MEFTGKTTQEAINAGLAELGLTQDEAKITVVQEEVKGLFKNKKAIVDIEKKATNGNRAVEFLQGIFEKANLNAKAELVNEEENIVINVITTSSASVIGYRGEVLDALQSLAGAVANIGNKTYVRVVVDCENYREKREETLINLAKKLADKAVNQGRDVSLEPMNPYERRVIHSTLADSDVVTTTSEGKEPNRFVVIIPNEKKEYVKRDFKRNDRPYNKDRRNDNRNGRFDRNNRNGNRSSSGFSSQAREPRKQPSSFGTYLGNSLKDEK